jgi:hypothetical protein
MRFLLPSKSGWEARRQKTPLVGGAVSAHCLVATKPPASVEAGIRYSYTGSFAGSIPRSLCVRSMSAGMRGTPIRISDAWKPTYCGKKKPLPGSLLEVGAGACVNVAFYRSLNPSLRATVIDLPETILFGYCFLKSVFPEIRIVLPNEAESTQTDESVDVRFLLPTQVDLVPDDSMDFSFNMSSFQEMTIETVNHYLRFMARTLKPGGTLLSVNLETSRYLERNALNNFDFSLYHAAPRVQPAPFGTDLVGHIPGLRIAHAEVVNAAQVLEAAGA